MQLSPHSFNADEHCIGDVQPVESITVMGCILLRTKTTYLSSNLEPLGRNMLDSEPKQSMILNKPVRICPIQQNSFVKRDLSFQTS